MTAQKPTEVPFEILKTLAADLWVAEPKVDGVLLLAIDGKPFSYNGKPLYNVEHIIGSLPNYGKGFAFIGEVAYKDWHHTVSIVRTQTPHVDAHKLVYYMFDVLTLPEWRSCESARPLLERRADFSSYWDFIEGNPCLRLMEQRPLPLMPLTSLTKAVLWMRKRCPNAAGVKWDGLVLKRKDSLYEFKRTKTWLKVKPKLTIDVPVLTDVPGKGKHEGRMGALTCEYNDVLFNVGTGFTDDEREASWPAGTIIEVECRGLHPSGTPIEPRFKRRRFDK